MWSNLNLLEYVFVKVLLIVIQGRVTSTYLVCASNSSIFIRKLLSQQSCEIEFIFIFYTFIYPTSFDLIQLARAGALLIVKNYNLGLIWENNSIYLFDSQSKDENGNLSHSCPTVVLKFYIRDKIM